MPVFGSSQFAFDSQLFGMEDRAFCVGQQADQLDADFSYQTGENTCHPKLESEKGIAESNLKRSNLP
jgi:hypothetical protein